MQNNNSHYFLLDCTHMFHLHCVPDYHLSIVGSIHYPVETIPMDKLAM